MELDQLEAFVSVATLGGFTRASEHLHRTQPAVSRRIQQLERSLGTVLFVRTPREARLTEAGRRFLPYAEGALATLTKGLEELRESHDKAPLHVALVGTLADLHLTRALTRFRSQLPGHEVTLRTATSREVSALVLRGDADMGIRYFEDFRKNVISTRLGLERLVLVAPADHRLAGRTVTRPADLAGDQWLSFPTDTRQPDSFGHLLLRALLDIGISEPNLTIVDSLTAQKRLVQAGYGLALLPPGSCEDELKGGRLAEIKVKGLAVTQPIFAVQQAGAMKEALIGRFVACLRETIR